MNRMLLFLTGAALILQPTSAMEGKPSENSNFNYDALVRAQIAEYEAIQRRRVPAPKLELKLEKDEESAQIAAYREIQEQRERLRRDETTAKELARQFATEEKKSQAPSFTEEDRLYLKQLQDEFGGLRIEESNNALVREVAPIRIMSDAEYARKLQEELDGGFVHFDGPQGDDGSYAYALKLQEEEYKGGAVEKKDEKIVIKPDNGDYVKGCEVLKQIPDLIKEHNRLHPDQKMDMNKLDDPRTMNFLCNILVAEMGITVGQAKGIIDKVFSGDEDDI